MLPIARDISEMHYNAKMQSQGIYNQCKYVSVIPCDLYFPGLDRIVLLLFLADLHDREVILNEECDSVSLAVFGTARKGYVVLILKKELVTSDSNTSTDFSDEGNE